MIVSTKYGEGRLILNEESDSGSSCVVQLSFGLLYAPSSSPAPVFFSDEQQEERSNDAKLLLSLSEDDEESSLSAVPPPPPTETTTSMDLEVAYHALEAMRRFNVEVECRRRGFDCCEGGVDLDRCCTACLLLSTPPAARGSTSQQGRGEPARSTTTTTTTTTTTCSRKHQQISTVFSRVASYLVPPCLRQRFLQEQQGGHTNSSKKKPSTTPNPTTSRQRSIPKGQPCLTCGAPVCPRHSASTRFRRHRQNRRGPAAVAVCSDCEPLLDIESVVDRLSRGDRGRRKAFVNRLVESYDRLLLRLECFEPYLRDLACHLAANAEQLATSSAAQTPTSHSNGGYLSVGMADWILALYELLQSLLIVTGTALTRAHLLRTTTAAVRGERQRVESVAPWVCQESDTDNYESKKATTERAMPRRISGTGLPLFSTCVSTPLDKAKALQRLCLDLRVFPSTASIAEGCEIFLTSIVEHEHGLKVEAVSRFLSALEELSCFGETTTMTPNLSSWMAAPMDTTTVAAGADPITTTTAEYYPNDQQMDPLCQELRRGSMSSTASSASVTSSSGGCLEIADPIIVDYSENTKHLRRESATSTTSVMSASSSSSFGWLAGGAEPTPGTSTRRDGERGKGPRLSLLQRITLHKQRESSSSFSVASSLG